MTKYRPTSLLTIFAQVLEVMYNRLSHHIRSHNIFIPEQFGFRNAAFKLTDNVL